MKLKFLYMVLFLGVSVLSSGTSVMNKFEEANNAYSESEYDKSISLYLEILDTGYSSAHIYYNLGNAYYKAGEVAPSILYYEKALHLKPADSDILYNLKLANLRINDRVEPVKRSVLGAWFYRVLNGFTVRQWSWLTIGIFWISLIFGLGFIFLRKKTGRQVLFSMALLILIIGSISLGLTIYKDRTDKTVTEAVIFSANVYVKSEPASRSTDLFIIHEGLKVKTGEKIDGWTFIEIGAGKQGWVPDDSYEII